MTTLLTSATNFNQQVQTTINKQRIAALRAPLPHLLPGNFIPATFLKGSNGTMRYLSVPDLSVSVNSGTVTPGTAPWLTEGTAPTTEAFSLGFEEFTTYQAGRILQISDVALMENMLDLLEAAGDIVARNLKATADLYCATKIKAGTNVIYAGSGNAASADVAAGDLIVGYDIKRGVALLRGANVPDFGSTYRAIIHPYVVNDLMNDDSVGGWIDASRYASPEQLQSGVIGRYAGVDFIQSSVAGIQSAGGTGGIDVYSTVIFGPGAFVFGDFGNSQSYYTAPGGQSDALHQNAKVGWKGFIGFMLAGAGANTSNMPAVKYIRVESATGI